MKRQALSHTKMKRLCRRLDIPTWQAVGLLESIWHLAARQTPRGDIGKLSDEDIALALDYREDPGKLMEALAAAGWLDQNAEHRFVIHGWPEHCEDSVNMRLAHAREFFADGQASKLARLGGKEREAAEVFYTSCAHTTAPKESVRTPSAPPRPSPPPRPNYAQPKPETRSAAETAAALNLAAEAFDPSDEERAEPWRGASPPKKLLLSSEIESALAVAAGRIHARHPAIRRCGLGEVKSRLRAIVRRAHPEKRLDVVRLVDANHAGWCATADWQQESGQYAKGLENWLAPTKGRWEESPPSLAARDDHDGYRPVSEWDRTS